jgi:hypothetical protein
MFGLRHFVRYTELWGQVRLPLEFTVRLCTIEPWVPANQAMKRGSTQGSQAAAQKSAVREMHHRWASHAVPASSRQRALSCQPAALPDLLAQRHAIETLRLHGMHAFIGWVS